MAKTIDGRAHALHIEKTVRDRIAARLAAGLTAPGLAVILLGDDPASDVYVRHKIAACARVGAASTAHRLPADTGEAVLLALIERLNSDPLVHGILCQVPLPEGIDTARVQRAIDPAKDVDGFHPRNMGRLFAGEAALEPCTPMAIIALLEAELDDLAGLDALVIGRSNIVGKPTAMMLLQRGCTITVAHSKTRDLPAIARRADIIVAAVGVPGMVRADWVKPGAVIIDVGITRVIGDDGKATLAGDVAFDEVQHARAVTPVPGGVGPMTIACLLSNTLRATKP